MIRLRDAAQLNSLEFGAPVLIKNLEDLNASPKLRTQALVDQAQRMEREGWERWGVSLPSLKPPIPWEGNRGSFDYSLHALEPLTTLIPAFEHSQDQSLYKLIIDLVEDWLKVVQAPLLSDAHVSIETILKTKQRAAWYDMAVGMRNLPLGLCPRSYGK